jgi:hypothetical protein
MEELPYHTASQAPTAACTPEHAKSHLKWPHMKETSKFKLIIYMTCRRDRIESAHLKSTVAAREGKRLRALSDHNGRGAIAGGTGMKSVLDTFHDSMCTLLETVANSIEDCAGMTCLCKKKDIATWTTGSHTYDQFERGWESGRNYWIYVVHGNAMDLANGKGTIWIGLDLCSASSIAFCSNINWALTLAMWPSLFTVSA